MTAQRKVQLLIAALVCANLAIWGAKDILASLYDPILRAAGA